MTEIQKLNKRKKKRINTLWRNTQGKLKGKTRKQINNIYKTYRKNKDIINSEIELLKGSERGIEGFTSQRSKKTEVYNVPFTNNDKFSKNVKRVIRLISTQRNIKGVIFVYVYADEESKSYVTQVNPVPVFTFNHLYNFFIDHFDLILSDNFESGKVKHLKSVNVNVTYK